MAPTLLLPLLPLPLPLLLVSLLLVVLPLPLSPGAAACSLAGTSAANPRESMSATSSGSSAIRLANEVQTRLTKCRLPWVLPSHVPQSLVASSCGRILRSPIFVHEPHGPPGSVQTACVHVSSTKHLSLHNRPSQRAAAN